MDEVEIEKSFFLMRIEGSRRLREGEVENCEERGNERESKGLSAMKANKRKGSKLSLH